jgi:hypothetical protein
VQTAHADKISSLAFPHQYGEVFATCSLGCIRVWHLRGCRELLRISLPNLECRCITFAVVSWLQWVSHPVLLRQFQICQLAFSGIRSGRPNSCASGQNHQLLDLGASAWGAELHG